MNAEITKEEYNIADFRAGVDGLLARRAYLTEHVLPLLVENQDWYSVKGRRSLSKGGSEKIASILNLVATFERDKETTECFSGEENFVAYICTLSRKGKVVAQARGAATLKSQGNDINRCLKVAEKRAYVSAVIRASCLSDRFTCDIEDLPPEMVSPAPKPPTPKPTNESASIPSNFWGLTDEDDFGNSYGSEMDMEQENIEREDEEIRQKHNEKEWRPATEKQKAFLASLILERCAEPTDRERFLNEMESADIGEASELISSFLMSQRY